MIADLKSYPAMKDSGIEWLGEVPEHWEARRLRTISEMRVSNVDKHTKEDETPVRLCNYVDVYKNDRISERMDFMRATATLEEIDRFRLESGDILITKDSEIWDDIGVPALVTEPADDLISGYHLALLRPFNRLLSGGYLFRALQSKPVAYQFHVEAKGVTRYGLSHDGIKSVWFPLPPLPEQTAIVRFLDYVIRRIRRYIRAKQKLIGLLEEEKQAIIHRAVTRGLDADVPLKPSGVEWLGDVPEHWDIPSAKQISKVFIPQRDKPELNEREGVPWITPEYTGAKYVALSGSFVSQDAARSSGSRSVSAGSVIASCIGRFGIASINEMPVIINQQLQAYLPTSAVDGRFLRYCVQVAKPYFEMKANSTTLAYVNRQGFGDMPLACPSRSEQEAIVRWIEEEESRISSVVLKANREIVLLREYRVRMIADVVTGKLDVREVAANLPDEPDEPKTLDESDDLISMGNAIEDDLDAIPEEAKA